MYSVSNPLRIPTIGVQWRCAYVCGSSSEHHISHTPAPEPHSRPLCSFFLRWKITYRKCTDLISTVGSRCLHPCHRNSYQETLRTLQDAPPADSRLLWSLCPVLVSFVLGLHRHWIRLENLCVSLSHPRRTFVRVGARVWSLTSFIAESHIHQKILSGEFPLSR